MRALGFRIRKYQVVAILDIFFFLCHDIELVLVLRWKDALKKAKIRSFSHLHTCGFLLVQDCLSKLGLGSFLLAIFGGVFG